MYPPCKNTRVLGKIAHCPAETLDQQQGPTALTQSLTCQVNGVRSGRDRWPQSAPRLFESWPSETKATSRRPNPLPTIVHWVLHLSRKKKVRRPAETVYQRKRLALAVKVYLPNTGAFNAPIDAPPMQNGWRPRKHCSSDVAARLFECGICKTNMHHVHQVLHLPQKKVRSPAEIMTRGRAQAPWIHSVKSSAAHNCEVGFQRIRQFFFSEYKNDAFLGISLEEALRINTGCQVQRVLKEKWTNTLPTCGAIFSRFDWLDYIIVSIQWVFKVKWSGKTKKKWKKKNIFVFPLIVRFTSIAYCSGLLVLLFI